MFRRILSLTVIICFFLTTLSPCPQAHADTVLGLPAPGTMVNLSPAYEPVIIKGLTVHKDNPFLFDFIVDIGQDKMSGEPLKKEGEKLIKYFLASLAIPDKDVWVNLSPYEKNRMIPEVLGQTDMGRDLLEQDYILKQITASLIYPEKQLGKTFWDKVYSKAQQMYGTAQVPVNTFNKVWIMADRAEVFEHNQTAFVVDSHLKVMLEEDYLALTKHQSQPNNSTHSITSKIVRAIILPELEKEVNTGKNFANLRQIFNSIILSSWYKKNLKEALLNQVYADQSKVKGINLNDPNVKQQIYEQYLKAYKKGVFNYIKEDVNTAGQTMPRKYFSGGMEIAPPRVDVITDLAMGSAAMSKQILNGEVDFSMLASTESINADATRLSSWEKVVIHRINNAHKSEVVLNIAAPYMATHVDIRRAAQERIQELRLIDEAMVSDRNIIYLLNNGVKIEVSWDQVKEETHFTLQTGGLKYETTKPGWSEEYRSWGPVLDILKAKYPGLTINGKGEIDFKALEANPEILKIGAKINIVRSDGIATIENAGYSGIFEGSLFYTNPGSPTIFSLAGEKISKIITHDAAMTGRIARIGKRIDRGMERIVDIIGSRMEPIMDPIVEGIGGAMERTIAWIVKARKRGVSQSLGTLRGSNTVIPATVIPLTVIPLTVIPLTVKGLYAEFYKRVDSVDVKQLFYNVKPLAEYLSSQRVLNSDLQILHYAGFLLKVLDYKYIEASHHFGFPYDSENLPYGYELDTWRDLAYPIMIARETVSEAIKKAKEAQVKEQQARAFDKSRFSDLKSVEQLMQALSPYIIFSPAPENKYSVKQLLRPDLSKEILAELNEHKNSDNWKIFHPVSELRDVLWHYLDERRQRPLLLSRFNVLNEMASLGSLPNPQKGVVQFEVKAEVFVSPDHMKNYLVSVLYPYQELLGLKSVDIERLDRHNRTCSISFTFKDSPNRVDLIRPFVNAIAKETMAKLKLPDALWGEPMAPLTLSDVIVKEDPIGFYGPIDAAMTANLLAWNDKPEAVEKIGDPILIGRFVSGTWTETHGLKHRLEIYKDKNDRIILHWHTWNDGTIETEPWKEDLYWELKGQEIEITALWGKLKSLEGIELRERVEKDLTPYHFSVVNRHMHGEVTTWLNKIFAELGSQEPAVLEPSTTALGSTNAADKAALANPTPTRGGIDLNTSNGMQWKVSKDGKGVEMNIDPAMIERIRREGIDSLSPVILSMTPVTSIWSLVGLQAPAK